MDECMCGGMHCVCVGGVEGCLEGFEEVNDHDNPQSARQAAAHNRRTLLRWACLQPTPLCSQQHESRRAQIDWRPGYAPPSPRWPPVHFNGVAHLALVFEFHINKRSSFIFHRATETRMIKLANQSDSGDVTAPSSHEE